MLVFVRGLSLETIKGAKNHYPFFGHVKVDLHALVPDKPLRRWFQIASWSNERFRRSHGDVLLLLEMVSPHSKTEPKAHAGRFVVRVLGARDLYRHSRMYGARTAPARHTRFFCGTLFPDR